MTRRQRIALALIGGLGVAAAPAAAWLSRGVSGAFLYLAPDAFYYLQVADQAAKTGTFTFDGTHPTTGFHPLWAILLRTAFQYFPSRDDQIVFAFATSVLLVAAGSALLVLVLTRFFRGAPLVLALLVPGLLHLLTLGTMAGTWSTVNGMESPLSLALLGVLLAVLPCQRESPPAPAQLAVWSVILTLAVLARLDDVFLVVGVAAAVAMRQTSWRERASSALLCGVLPAAVTVMYLLFNWRVSGFPMPSSAAVKDGWALASNLAVIARVFAPLGPQLIGSDGWLQLAPRLLNTVVPVAIGIVWLWRHRSHRRTGGRQMTLEALAFYVVLKGAYNLAFVWIWHHGPWYFVSSIVAAGVLLLDLRQREASAPFPASVPARRRDIPFFATALASVALAAVAVPYVSQGGAVAPVLGAGLVACGACLLVWGAGRSPAAVALMAWVVFAANSDVASRISRDTGEMFARTWADRARLKADLIARSGTPVPRIVEFDDGILTYALEVPGLAGFGLAADSAAVDAKKQGALLRLAYDRGFRILASLYYVPPFGATASPSAIVAQFPSMDRERLDLWTFTPMLHDKATGALFLAFDPK